MQKHSRDNSSSSNKDTTSNRSRARNTEITATDPGNTPETEITAETTTGTKANNVKGDREQARDGNSSGGMASGGDYNFKGLIGSQCIKCREFETCPRPKTAGILSSLQGMPFAANV